MQESQFVAVAVKLAHQAVQRFVLLRDFCPDDNKKDTSNKKKDKNKKKQSQGTGHRELLKPN